MANAQEIIDAAKVIESFADGTCGPYDWDDFLSRSWKDSELQKIREECERVEIDYPARNEHEWCSEEGIGALMTIAGRLRREIARAAGAGKTHPEEEESKPNKPW